MALDADTLLDRVYLKQQIGRWRNLAIVAFLIVGIVLFADTVSVKDSIGSYVARIDVNGMITRNDKRDEMIYNLAYNDAVDAVLIRMDSPGGTAVGGEELYIQIKRLAEIKPVVVLMSNMCTSACYMAALGADHVIAREGTITGSIGVVIQSFEATKLVKDLGIEPVIIKSDPLKATPNPLEKVTSAQRAQIQTIIDNFYVFFRDLVKEERDYDEAQVNKVADGRVFSGSQAVEENLIDSLGGQREAMTWLEEHHDISKDSNVRKIKPKRDRKNILEELAGGVRALNEKTLPLTLDGMMLIWQPTAN